MRFMDKAKEALGLKKMDEYSKIFENVHALRFFDGGNCVSYVAPEGERTEINYHKASGKYKLCNGHVEDLANGLTKVDIFGFEQSQKTIDIVDKTRKRGLILRHKNSTLFLNLQADCQKYGIDVTCKMAMGLKSVLEDEIKKGHSYKPIETPNYLPEGVAASA